MKTTIYGSLQNNYNKDMNYLELKQDTTLSHNSEMQYFNSFFQDLLKGLQSGKYITDKGTKYSLTTIRHYKNAYDWFVFWEAHIGIQLQMNEVIYNTVEMFKTFLSNYHLTLNSVSVIISKIKSVLNFAFKSGKHFWNGTGIKIVKEKNPKTYLTIEELKQMRSCKSLTSAEEMVLDNFTIQFYIGQRYETTQRFLKQPFAFTKQHGEFSYIEIEAYKTGTVSYIPLGEIVKGIIQKYNGLVPVYSRTYINRIIKVVAFKAGLIQLIATRETRNQKVVREFIPKYSLISTHTARRSLVSNLKQLNFSNQSIMGITSHGTEVQLNDYNRSQVEKIKSILGHEFFNKI